MFDHDDSLPEWMVEALRQPVATSMVRRARIMELVRAEPVRRRRDDRAQTRERRGVAAPLIGLALAAGIAGVLATAGLLQMPRSGGVPPSTSVRAMVIADTTGASLHDTLRLWMPAPFLSKRDSSRDSAQPVMIIGGDST